MPAFQSAQAAKKYKEILQEKAQIDQKVGEIDQNIRNVLEKHEYEYMQAYNIFVKHKESEIKGLIDKITERTGDKQANEAKLERALKSEAKLREQYYKAEKENVEMKKEI